MRSRFFFSSVLPFSSFEFVVGVTYRVPPSPEDAMVPPTMALSYVQDLSGGRYVLLPLVSTFYTPGRSTFLRN